MDQDVGFRIVGGGGGATPGGGIGDQAEGLGTAFVSVEAGYDVYELTVGEAEFLEVLVVYEDYLPGLQGALIDIAAIWLACVQRGLISRGEGSPPGTEHL